MTRPAADPAGGPAATAEGPATPAAEAAPARSRHSAGPVANPSRWNLVVPGLLVVALVLLVVGLITSTAPWLAASLVASVFAAVLLVVERLVHRRTAPEAAPADPVAEPAPADAPGPDAPIDLDAPAIDPDDPNAVWVVDGRPRYHRRDCATLASLTAEPIPREQALEDGFTACSLCEPGVGREPAPA